MKGLGIVAAAVTIAVVAASCTGGTARSPSPPPTSVPTATAAGTDGPGRGTPTLVSVGDSYISGEGGRWAGNVDLVGTLDSSAIDALGPTAYYDNADKSAETIANCHRSAAAEIHIGTGQDGSVVSSINLACSGATTLTHVDGADFKPGLDAFGDPDANLATNEQAAAAGLPFDNVRVLDLSAAYDGRRLCENTVGTLNEKALTSWRDAGAVDQTEWIAPVRAVFNNDHFGDSAPYQMQESFHPDYWGELALRDCLRLAYNNGAVQSGKCTIATTGLNERGEPIMQLTPG